MADDARLAQALGWAVETAIAFTRRGFVCVAEWAEVDEPMQGTTSPEQQRRQASALGQWGGGGGGSGSSRRRIVEPQRESARMQPNGDSAASGTACRPCGVFRRAGMPEERNVRPHESHASSSSNSSARRSSASTDSVGLFGSRPADAPAPRGGMQLHFAPVLQGKDLVPRQPGPQSSQAASAGPAQLPATRAAASRPRASPPAPPLAPGPAQLPSLVPGLGLGACLVLRVVDSGAPVTSPAQGRDSVALRLADEARASLADAGKVTRPPRPGRRHDRTPGSAQQPQAAAARNDGAPAAEAAEQQGGGAVSESSVHRSSGLGIAVASAVIRLFGGALVVRRLAPGDPTRVRLERGLERSGQAGHLGIAAFAQESLNSSELWIPLSAIEAPLGASPLNSRRSSVVTVVETSGSSVGGSVHAMGANDGNPVPATDSPGVTSSRSLVESASGAHMSGPAHGGPVWQPPKQTAVVSGTSVVGLAGARGTRGLGRHGRPLGSGAAHGHGGLGAGSAGGAGEQPTRAPRQPFMRASSLPVDLEALTGSTSYGSDSPAGGRDRSGSPADPQRPKGGQGRSAHGAAGGEGRSAQRESPVRQDGAEASAAEHGSALTRQGSLRKRYTWQSTPRRGAVRPELDDDKGETEPQEGALATLPGAAAQASCARPDTGIRVDTVAAMAAAATPQFGDADADSDSASQQAEAETTDSRGILSRGRDSNRPTSLAGSWNSGGNSSVKLGGRVAGAGSARGRGGGKRQGAGRTLDKQYLSLPVEGVEWQRSRASAEGASASPPTAATGAFLRGSRGGTTAAPHSATARRGRARDKTRGAGRGANGVPPLRSTVSAAPGGGGDLPEAGVPRSDHAADFRTAHGGGRWVADLTAGSAVGGAGRRPQHGETVAWPQADGPDPAFVVGPRGWRRPGARDERPGAAREAGAARTADASRPPVDAAAALRSHRTGRRIPTAAADGEMADSPAMARRRRAAAGSSLGEVSTARSVSARSSAQRAERRRARAQERAETGKSSETGTSRPHGSGPSNRGLGAAAAAAFADPSQRPPWARPDGSRLHVLVVDDDPAVRRSTTRALERIGVQVTALTDGSEVVPFLRQADEAARGLSHAADVGGPSSGSVADVFLISCLSGSHSRGDGMSPGQASPSELAAAAVAAAPRYSTKGLSPVPEQLSTQASPRDATEAVPAAPMTRRDVTAVASGAVVRAADAGNTAGSSVLSSMTSGGQEVRPAAATEATRSGTASPSAASGASAPVLVGAGIDLILMDIVMPQDGEFTALQLRSLGFDKPIVAATGTAAPQALERFVRKSGFDEVITKPFSRSDLEPIIARVRDGKLRSAGAGDP